MYIVYLKIYLSYICLCTLYIQTVSIFVGTYTFLFIFLYFTYNTPFDTYTVQVNIAVNYYSFRSNRFFQYIYRDICIRNLKEKKLIVIFFLLKNI